MNHLFSNLLRAWTIVAVALSGASLRANDLDTIVEKQFLKSDDIEIDGSFGYSVAVDGDTMVVGEAKSGDRTIPAVRVYRKVESVWELEATLRGDNTEVGDYFGSSVAIQGNTVVVGAIGEESNGSSPADNSFRIAGAVYVFEKTGGMWQQTAYLKSSRPIEFARMGETVAIDGGRIAAGSSQWVGGPGAVEIFEKIGGRWQHRAVLQASNGDRGDSFGWRFALKGDTVVVSAPSEDGNGVDPADDSLSEAGAVYVFEENGGAWSETQYIKAPVVAAFSFFGNDIALSEDWLVAGASRDDDLSGALYVYRKEAGQWMLFQKLAAPQGEDGDLFGSHVAAFGNMIAASAPAEDGNGVDGIEDNSIRNAGAVYLFRFDEGSFEACGYFKSSSPMISEQLVFDVALSDGELFAANPFEDTGANREGFLRDSGIVYVFDLPSATVRDPGITGGEASRPDLWVGKSIRKMRGNDVYRKRSAGRKQSFTLRRRIFRRSVTKVHLRIENDGTKRDTVRVIVRGARLSGLKPRAVLVGQGKRRNVTGRLTRKKLKVSLDPGESVRVYLRVSTNRFWAGVQRNGKRENRLRISARSGAKADRGEVVTKFYQ